MQEITPPDLTRAIRWLQEKLVSFALLLAVLSMIFSAVAVTFTITRSIDMQDRITELSDDVAVYQIYTAKLHADLAAHGYEVPDFPGEQ